MLASDSPSPSMCTPQPSCHLLVGHLHRLAGGSSLSAAASASTAEVQSVHKTDWECRVVVSVALMCAWQVGPSAAGWVSDGGSRPQCDGGWRRHSGRDAWRRTAVQVWLRASAPLHTNRTLLLSKVCCSKAAPVHPWLRSSSSSSGGRCPGESLVQHTHTQAVQCTP